MHAEGCRKKADPNEKCTCFAGKGLARSAEGFHYSAHDSKRAMERRKRQIDKQLAKARDW